jgi:hypothetical protein
MLEILKIERGEFNYWNIINTIVSMEKQGQIKQGNIILEIVNQ